VVVTFFRRDLDDPGLLFCTQSNYAVYFVFSSLQITFNRFYSLFIVINDITIGPLCNTFKNFKEQLITLKSLLSNLNITVSKFFVEACSVN